MLTANGATGTVVGNVITTPPSFQEFAWSDENNLSSNFQNGIFGATGGGMSTVFPTPPYQTAAGITQFTDSSNTVRSGGRFVPDISGMVGFQGFFINGIGWSGLGTSGTSPFYAGLFATLRSAFGTSFGFLNPLLYQVANQAFSDVTIGNNDTVATPDPPFFFAGNGYDPTTGWGSIDGTRMLNALAQILYPKNMYITVVKDSFGLTEVAVRSDWTNCLRAVVFVDKAVLWAVSGAVGTFVAVVLVFVNETLLRAISDAIRAFGGRVLMFVDEAMISAVSLTLCTLLSHFLQSMLICWC